MPPKASKKRGAWLWRVVFIASTCGLAVVLALLAPVLWEYAQSARGYDEARQIARPVEQNAPAQTESSSGGYYPSDEADEAAQLDVLDAANQPYESPIDFEALARQNPDVIGWLLIEDTYIDYPVVWRRGDNKRYLTRGFNGKNNSSGCLFLDGTNAPDWSNGNNLVYGHNMKDGSMFGTLKRFRDANFAKSHEKLTLYTPKGEYELLPFSAFGDRDTGLYMARQPEDKDKALDWMLEIRARSDVDFGITPQKGDRIATLVTCSTAEGEERFVLCAIMIEI